MNYSEKLKDPRWQKRRLEILSRDEFTCQACYSEDKMLVVHHLSYSGDPWDATDEMLMTLCEDCHNEEHEAKKMLGKASRFCSESNTLNIEVLSLLNSLLYKGAMSELNIVSADMIAYALTDEECMNFIYKKYTSKELAKTPF